MAMWLMDLVRYMYLKLNRNYMKLYGEEVEEEKRRCMESGGGRNQLTLTLRRVIRKLQKIMCRVQIGGFVRRGNLGRRCGWKRYRSSMVDESLVQSRCRSTDHRRSTVLLIRFTARSHIVPVAVLQQRLGGVVIIVIHIMVVDDVRRGTGTGH